MTPTLIWIKIQLCFGQIIPIKSGSPQFQIQKHKCGHLTAVLNPWVNITVYFCREQPTTPTEDKSKEDTPSFHASSGYKSAYHTKQEEPSTSSYARDSK